MCSAHNAGFEPLFIPAKPGESPRVEEVSCMAHARRYFFELHKAVKSPLAKEAVDRIDVLYDIEEHIPGKFPGRTPCRTAELCRAVAQ